MTKDRVSAHFDVHKVCIEELKKLAADEGISQTAMLERLVREAYDQTIVDPNILLVRLDRQDKAIERLQQQLDTLGQVHIASLKYIFYRFNLLTKKSSEIQNVLKPEAEEPQTLEARKQEKARKVKETQDLFTEGAEETAKVLKTCRETFSKQGLSFMQSVWIDPDALAKAYEEAYKCK